jgi:mannose-6-phosphate isomerase
MTDEETKIYEDLRAQINVSDFSTQSYVRKVEKPWGYELHFLPDNLPYMGKMHHIYAGKRLSLQAHDQKQESYILLDGDGWVLLEDSDGKMQKVKLLKNEGITTLLGQKHRLFAGESDANIIEFSSQEIGNTFRLEDDYGRETETEQARAERNDSAK